MSLLPANLSKYLWLLCLILGSEIKSLGTSALNRCHECLPPHSMHRVMEPFQDKQVLLNGAVVSKTQPY